MSVMRKDPTTEEWVVLTTERARRPHELAAIEALRLCYSDMRQVACFETAFHRSMPHVAQIYALPREFWDEGVPRYGFHRISCEYILEELASEVGSRWP